MSHCGESARTSTGTARTATSNRGRIRMVMFPAAILTDLAPTNECKCQVPSDHIVRSPTAMPLPYKSAIGSATRVYFSEFSRKDIDGSVRKPQVDGAEQRGSQKNQKKALDKFSGAVWLAAPDARQNARCGPP